MTAIGKVIFDIQLSAKECKAIERLTGHRVLKNARLEVKVQIEMEQREKATQTQSPAP